MAHRWEEEEQCSEVARASPTGVVPDRGGGGGGDIRSSPKREGLIWRGGRRGGADTTAVAGSSRIGRGRERGLLGSWWGSKVEVKAKGLGLARSCSLLS